MHTPIDADSFIGQGKIFSYFATNYSELLTKAPTPNINEIAYVYETQGIQYLPGSWGGDYYPQGSYIYNGSNWISDKNALNNQIQDNIDTILTKLDDVIAGTNITIDKTDPLNPIINASGGSAKFKRSFDTYNMPVPSSYTWNSETVGAASATMLNERFRFYACSGMNSGHEGAYANIVLPNSYVAGANINITLASTSNTDAKNYVFYVGITEPKGSGDYGGATETEWIKKTIASALDWPQPKTLYVFDGTNMNPGDELSIMIYRDPNDAADDMSNADAYIGGFLIEEV